MASLYRKWRSRTFDDLVGQDHVVRTLRNAVSKHRVAHAYLFTGPRGTGKTSTARILAKAVNCLHPSNGNPCDKCEMCRAANEGRALDVIEIDAASNTSVDNVRDLRERVAYAAGEGTYKVYIVDEVHRLSGAAFDAFLKTLEEPPSHVIFVFASTEPHKVPETITSRCQRFDFRRISPGETLERLRFVAQEENLDVRDEALRVVALQSGGSLRDALGLLDQVASYTESQITDADVRTALGLADSSLVTLLMDCLLSRDIGRGLAQIAEFVDGGGDPHQLTRQFVEYLRALLLQLTGLPPADTSLDPALADQLGRHAVGLQAEQVVGVIRSMAEQSFSSKFNLPAQLPFELAYVQAALSLGPPVRRSRPDPSPEPAIQAQEVRATAETIPSPQYEEPASADLPTAPAAVEARTPGTPGDVESTWPAIVAAMRSKSPSLQAVLRSGYLMKAVEGEITIGFLYDFHRNQFAEPKNRKVLEDVIGEILGTGYRVTSVRTTKEEIESVRGADALQKDDGFIEEVVERLREFHAKELRNGHS